MQDWEQSVSAARVLVLGDVMLDHYIFGQVSRISPEAPVPVLETTKERYLLGGAANVAHNLISMGLKACMLSTIGVDAAGRRLYDMLEDRGVDTSGLARMPLRPTTIKTRLIAGQQQMLRVDRETRLPLQSQEEETLIETLEETVREGDVLVVSDYGKGLVTETVMDSVRSLAKKFHLQVLCDPKVRDFRRYRGLSCLTPNQTETEMAIGRELADPKEVGEIGQSLRDDLALESILITMGARGMVLFSENHSAAIETEAREVFDVTGAGDTVISTLSACRALGLNWERSARIANRAAGIVVGKLGAAAPSREEFLCLLKQFD